MSTDRLTAPCAPHTHTVKAQRSAVRDFKQADNHRGTVGKGAVLSLTVAMFATRNVGRRRPERASTKSNPRRSSSCGTGGAYSSSSKKLSSQVPHCASNQHVYDAFSSRRDGCRPRPYGDSDTVSSVHIHSSPTVAPSCLERLCHAATTCSGALRVVLGLLLAEWLKFAALTTGLLLLLLLLRRLLLPLPPLPPPPPPPPPPPLLPLCLRCRRAVPAGEVRDPISAGASSERPAT